MKNLFITLSIGVLTMVSCSNPMDKVHEDITQKVKESLKNPKSLVLDSISAPDTLRLSDKLNDQVMVNYQVANEYGEKMQEQLKWFDIFVTYDNKKEALDQAKIYGKVFEKFTQKGDSIKDVMNKVKGTAQDTITGYVFEVHGQASNSYGAQVNLKISALTNQNFGDIKIQDNE